MGETELRINLLVERLNKLERTNRALKIVVATLILGLTVMSMRPAIPEALQKQLLQLPIPPQISSHLY